MSYVCQWSRWRKAWLVINARTGLLHSVYKRYTDARHAAYRLGVYAAKGLDYE